MANQEECYKIKIVCRLTEDLHYQQEIFIDGQPCTSIPDTVQAAERFLDAFSPETQLRNAEEELDSTNIVLVFRTSSEQMQPFYDMFQENFTEST